MSLDNNYTLKDDDAAIVFNGDDIYLMIPQKEVYDPDEDSHCFTAMVLAVAIKEADPQLMEVISRYTDKLYEMNELDIEDGDEIEAIIDLGDEREEENE